MKRIQCTKCGQTFWTDLKIDETLIESGEWIQSPCPRCGAEWAVVEPGTRKPRATKRAKPGPKRRARQMKAPPPAEGKAPVFSPPRIRNLRKKLVISQKELAALTGVSTGAIVSWEKGKFKPKENKVAQLASLAEKGKEEVKKLLAEKIQATHPEADKAERKGKKQTGRGKAPPPGQQKS